uniref:uncharacterized protein LOC122596522 n=1 Tax=Erigeron canadensis TaxID=72917 RepID=UPI001CB8BCE9|nr:uncharacterized protein LOC122596522 [Erigeron canadensis]
MAGSTIVRGAGRNKRAWTTKEDEKLVDTLMDLQASGKYACADNGFKPGYYQAIQRLLDLSLPNSGLKAEPHIKSRLKTLKANFGVLSYMLSGTHGFTWDPKKCCVTADDQVWDEYIKTHKNASHIKDKPFPFYDKLSIIFGKNKNMGSRALDIGGEQVGETERSAPNEFEDRHVDPVETKDLHIDLDEVEDLHNDPVVPFSEGDTGSLSSKRKRDKHGHFHHNTCNNPYKVSNITRNIGRELSTNYRILAGEGASSVDLMRRVVKEINGLSGITLDERIIAMDVIGHSPTRAEMFFMLDKTGKIRMVQMIGCGSIS